ncbi:MAG: glycoside hydrolase family 97 N-terminal domain-containing protein, partial [Flavobacterium sp.]|nr:glycoside hydrolase family 97 N-terminal domain-containing protein [Flavobacterium sp.]
MKKIISLCLLFVISFGKSQTILSPSKNISLNFQLSQAGKATYSVLYKNKSIVKESNLGLNLKNLPALNIDFVIENQETKSIDESWKPVLGEQAIIQNKYNQITYFLVQKSSRRKLNIVFKVYNEGVAFRYEFPKQDNLNYFVISDENTQFNLTGNHKTFWIPGDFDSQEYVYNETKLSEIDNDKLDLNNGIALKSIAGRFVIQSPLMMKSTDNLYINIFEAAVVNYPVMHLDLNPQTFGLTAHLVPNAIGDKAYLQTPSVSPYRTIMVSDDARDIVASKMILNLNEPCKLDDTSWIKPMKYVGIWWEMHVGKSTWDYAG